QLGDPRPDVGTFPDPAGQRRGDDVGTRSCVGDGNRPAAAIASATASTSVIPRNCTLPRAVNSSVPEPNSLDSLDSVAIWAAVIMPPGSRTRTSAPSAARCTCSAPGQASLSRALTTYSPYGVSGGDHPVSGWAGATP